jgi:D-beta-D-heptose 7-phosphate kinase/D-beta-D-heptose 1-phosphate adenosyltransferase
VTEAVRKALPKLDAIIFEDYGKGFLGAELIGQIIKDATAEHKIVAADPNPHHAFDWTGTTVVKPNRAEAFSAAGIAPRDSDLLPSKDQDLLRVGEILLKKWKTKLVLITLGEQGMMLFQHNQPPHHIPTRARQVFDVSGAGDTAIALFTLALCSGATPTEAAEIANHASAVVVAKLGTATVGRDELVASFREDLERA